MSPEGTLDGRQYIYFDPKGREVIFFGDDSQQIYNWQNSSYTRYGLYITAQNISVTTLRRVLDIELASLDSIRVKTFEDVRMKIGMNNPWDGSYRRAGTFEKNAPPAASAANSYINARYNGSIGNIRFSPDGVYELTSGGTQKRGRYAFFRINVQEVLELRTYNADRETYRVERSGNEGGENLSLSRIRIGAMGIQDLHEGVIILTQAAAD
ncbi:hypothetical protein FACS189491_12130 [Spirochaetia bacterium]|nr:hypothetical protein FACS189491_12130 [Spirochaetia bacterium]